MITAFQNCKYRWDLDDLFNPVFKALHFITENEFDSFAKAIQAACREYQVNNSSMSTLISLPGKQWAKIIKAVRASQLNSELKEQFYGLMDYLVSPELHIQGSIVKDKPQHYNLTPEQIMKIPQQEFESLCVNAYKAVVMEIFMTKAKELQNLTSLERMNRINQSRLVRREKQAAQKRLQDAAQRAQNIIPPRPLFEILGGEDKYQAVINELNANSKLNECKDVSGQISGLYKDIENIRWEFEVIAHNTDQFAIVIKNYDALNLDSEKPPIAAQEIGVYKAMPRSWFPRGAFQYSHQTVAELLFTHIQQLAYAAAMTAYAQTYEYDTNLVNARLQAMDQLNDYPPREQLRTWVVNAAQQPEANLTELEIRALFAQMTGLPMGLLAVEHSDDEDEAMENSSSSDEDNDDHVLRFSSRVQREGPRRNPPRQARPYRPMRVR